MQIDLVRVDIKKRRENNETYESISRTLGINRAMVKYIETHPNYTPSKRIMAILFQDPPKSLQATRERNATLNEIARSWGYASWSAYGTEQIRIFRGVSEVLDTRPEQE